MKKDTHSLSLPILALLLAMMFWGSSFVVMKIALRAWDPLLAIFGRLLVASVVFLLLARKFGNIEYRTGDWKLLAFMSLCEPCLYFTFEAHALKYTSASEAATITALLPLMTVFAARYMLEEKLSRKVLVGIGSAVIGVLGLTWFSNTSENAPCPVLGNGLEFLAMICATGYTIACRYLSQRYSALFLTALPAFIGTIFFMPALLFSRWENDIQFSPPILASIVYLGVIVNVLTYFLFNYGLSRLSASRVSLYINLIPVFSMLFGWLILSEQLSSAQYLAAALVMGGTFFGQGSLNSAHLWFRTKWPNFKF